MKMEIIGSEFTTRVITRVSHGAASIDWDAGVYEKAMVLDPKVVAHINAFWQTLPTGHQDQIFSVYATIKNICESYSNYYTLMIELQGPVAELIDLHPIDHVWRWVSLYSDIVIPEKLPEQFVQSDDRPGTREKTYTKSDYRDLIVMTLVLRCMIPIWGEFIYRCDRQNGTAMKEFWTCKLLNRSSILHCPAMQKLQTYIEKNTVMDSVLYMYVVMTGLAAEDFPYMLLALVLIRRLSVGDISGTGITDTNLVTYIYNYVTSKSGSTTSGVGSGAYREKRFDDNGNDDNAASRMEGVKIHQGIALGRLIVYDVYALNPTRTAMTLDPAVDLDLLQVFLTHISHLGASSIEACQITVTQWVVAPVMPPASLLHLSKERGGLMNMIAVAQTWLWQRGHKVLAALLSATLTNTSGSVQLSGISTRTRIPKALLDELASYYFAANRTSSRKDKNCPYDLVIADIDKVSLGFGDRDWNIHLPKELRDDIIIDKISSTLSVPTDIKERLAIVILQLLKDKAARHSAKGISV